MANQSLQRRRAIAQERMNLAIRKFKEGVSLRRATEIAGVDYWDFQLELDRRGIPIMSSVTLARRRVKK